MTESLRRYWQARSSTEQRMLRLLGVFLAGVAIYTAAMMPLQRARAHLEATLPHWRAQLDAATAMAERLQRLPQVNASGGRVVDLVNAFGVPARSTSAAGNDEGVTIAAIDFDQWLLLLPEIERRLGVTLKTCDLTPAGAAGKVQVKAVFSSGKAPS